MYFFEMFLFIAAIKFSSTNVRPSKLSAYEVKNMFWSKCFLELRKPIESEKVFGKWQFNVYLLQHNGCTCSITTNFE